MSDDLGRVPSPPTGPQRFGWWALASLGLFVLLTVGAYFYQVFAAESELRAAFAEVERTDPRWQLADIEADRASVPPEANSAPAVMKAKRLLPSDWPFWDRPYSAAAVPGEPPEAEKKRFSTAWGRTVWTTAAS